MSCILFEDTLIEGDTNQTSEDVLCTVTELERVLGAIYSFKDFLMKTNFSNVPKGSMGYKTDLNKKISLTERYMKISESAWFKEAYNNRTIGESHKIE